MRCPECGREMQELYTRSSQTGEYARVGFICPWDDIIVIDEWSEKGTYIAHLEPLAEIPGIGNPFYSEEARERFMEMLQGWFEEEGHKNDDN
jgi:hypothetical protein